MNERGICQSKTANLFHLFELKPKNYAIPGRSRKFSPYTTLQPINIETFLKPLISDQILLSNIKPIEDENISCLSQKYKIVTKNMY